MYVVDCPSEGGDRGIGDGARLGEIRVRGGLAITVAASAGMSRLVDLEERGGFRAKFPACDEWAEAVAINTGGGIVGGDRASFTLTVGEGAAMTFATQSAERVYHALTGAANMRVTFSVGRGASLHWLPQETILYDGARLDRTIDADLAADATLLMSEAVVFGREAMGEDVNSGSFRDRWRLSRDGRPIYVDAVAIDGDIHAQLQQGAVGAGGRAAATVVYVAPDAEARRDSTREAIAQPCGRAAISAWNGMLVARFLAPSAAALRKDLTCALTHLSRRPMPRVWNC